MTDNIIDLEAHFIDEQVYNQRLKLSDSEISDAIKKEITQNIRTAMQMFGHRIKGYHIQIYGDVVGKDGMASQIYIVQNLMHTPDIDPIYEADDYINDDA